MVHMSDNFTLKTDCRGKDKERHSRLRGIVTVGVSRQSAEEVINRSASVWSVCQKNTAD